ncbi:MAG: hypothetical protein NT031_16065 [Planctomycetota bacterium]|nr:hypothetical protein [Planctomycetota bacterium]
MNQDSWRIKYDLMRVSYDIDRYLKTYNLPELVTGPVAVTEKELVSAIGASPVDAKDGAVSRTGSPVSLDGRPHQRD